MDANGRLSLTLREARIMFRDFAGERGKYPGRRFVLVIPNDLVDALANDGWPIKYLENKYDSDAEALPILNVTVQYKPIEPKIWQVTKKDGASKRVLLTEKNIACLDTAEIERVDIKINLGKTKKSVYVDTMYVTIAEDSLEAMYADIEDEVPFE